MIRNFLKIWSDFSEEEIVLSDDVLPPGRELAELVANELERNGFDIGVGVSQHDSYGWYFEVSLERSTLWCMLQLSDEWLMIFRQEGPMLRKLLGQLDREEIVPVLNAVNLYVADTKRIVKHGWLTEKEMSSDFAGASAPV